MPCMTGSYLKRPQQLFIFVPPVSGFAVDGRKKYKPEVATRALKIVREPKWSRSS